MLRQGLELVVGQERRADAISGIEPVDKFGLILGARSRTEASTRSGSEAGAISNGWWCSIKV